MTQLSDEFSVGEIVVFDQVYAVNRITGEATRELRQFVVVESSQNGFTLYPTIIANGKNRTVTQQPAPNAKPRRIA
jgi:hypothetical protein